jgi:peptidoglycan hydrolase-like protein with peptidoglycan-binding domain
MIVLLGAALLPGAAPFFLFAAAPQTKKSSPAKHVSVAKKTGKASRKRPARPRAQKAPTPERIREIQTALAQTGYYAGTTTGKWDARSVQAMKEFQQANGLTPTGKLDAKSLQKLGLGSEIAGVAPPRTPAVDAKPKSPRP